MATTQYVRYPNNSGSGGVTSLNALTGAVVLAAGSGISITPSGNTLTIAATGSGANTALSNLTTTSINQSLLPDTDNTYDIGTEGQDWAIVHARSLITGMDLVPVDLQVGSYPQTSGGNPNASGDVFLTSGNARAGGTGSLHILSGGIVGGGAGDTGDITISTGNVGSGTRGIISLNGLNINVNSKNIKNVLDPVAAQDAATKNYVDNHLVPVTSGGTGLTTLTANNVILGNGTSNPTFVAPGSSGNVLTSNGTTWTSAAPASSGANTTLSNLTSPTSINQSLLPSLDDNFILGNSTVRYRNPYFSGTLRAPRIFATNAAGSVDQLKLDGVGVTLPTGGTEVAISTIANINLNVVTADSSATTNKIQLLTGNSTTSGNSGNIVIQTGTVVSGTRGSIILDSAAVTVNGSTAISVTITTAQLTPVTGTQGSMTFVNGLLTAQVQAT